MIDIEDLSLRIDGREVDHVELTFSLVAGVCGEPYILQVMDDEPPTTLDVDSMIEVKRGEGEWEATSLTFLLALLLAQ